MNLIIQPRLEIGLKGFFRLQTINKFSGKITSDTGWFPNTILDAGRNVMASRADWMDWCQVGTNGTFPELLVDRQAETSLGNWHAGTDLVVAESNGQAGSAPYYGWKRKTWRFPTGSVAAILAEAAVGWGVDGSQIISRAPILDPILQTPTTVTPLADEALDVSYELRYYPPLIDVAGPQVTLAGVVYDTLTRAASVTGDGWSYYIGDKIGYYHQTNTDWYATDGVIGTILTGPSGVVSNTNAAIYTNRAYANNSYEQEVNIQIVSADWNLGSGIRSMHIATKAGYYQTQFSAAAGGATIPKSIAYGMSMDWTLSWAEKV